jgi:hypothetical protein
MAQDLLALLEQQKDLLYPETYARIKDNYNQLPDDVKDYIFTQLKNASFLAQMISEYENQRLTAVQEAIVQLNSVKNDCMQTYKQLNSAIEEDERGGDSKTADEELNSL